MNTPQAPCPICDTRAQKIYDRYNGYLEGTAYDIYECRSCMTSFVLSGQGHGAVYDIIYGRVDSAAYDRYFMYAEGIKAAKNKIKFLCQQEEVYYPIWKYLKKIKELKILEIGCSYGYLTHAMRQMGHDAVGIDIAEQAIRYAVEHFGDHFRVGDLAAYKKNSQDTYDLIVATELIEHIQDPNAFLADCSSMLKDDGAVLLTTPNKDFAAGNNAIWKTDLPPVHLLWAGQRSMESLSRHNGMRALFLSFKGSYPHTENKLLSYLIMKFKKEPQPHALLKDGTTNPTANSSRMKNLIKFVAIQIPPVRIASNLFYDIFFKRSKSLCALLRPAKKPYDNE